MPTPIRTRRNSSFYKMEDLLVAYRHVKAELYHERSIPVRIDLANYEENLLSNLESLHDNLKTASLTDNSSLIDSEFIGKTLQFPKEWSKKSAVDRENQDPKPHIFATDAKANWEKGRTEFAPPRFRTMAIPSIDFQILGMLWVMKVGHLLDAKLSSACRGNRLNRIPKSGTAETGELNNDSPHIFQSYHSAYSNWRKDGLKAIEAELLNDHRVIAVTMDLRNYFHRIDPSFLNDFRFFGKNFDLELDLRQKGLTSILTEALVSWARQSPEGTGIPVGLLASRLIANALLHETDTAIVERINPVFYGRYVDDFMIVIRPGSKSADASSIMDFIASNLDDMAELNFDSTLTLHLKYVGDSRLEFGVAKQRIFDFQGRSGLDFLTTVSREMDELSSEFRLAPDFMEGEETILKEVITAEHDRELGMESLRQADSLTIRRMGLAIMLRNHELLERCLDSPKEWEKVRYPFYQLLEDHVLTPERYCIFFQYLPRIFSMIASNGDWGVGERLLAKIDWIQSEIEKAATL